MSDRRLFSSDYVFKTIKNEDVENIIKSVRRQRRTTKNDRGSWDEFKAMENDKVISSPRSSNNENLTQISSIETVTDTVSQTQHATKSSRSTPIKVRRLSDLEINDFIDRAISEVFQETTRAQTPSREIQNKPRKSIKRLERFGNNSAPSENFNHQGDGHTNNTQRAAPEPPIENPNKLEIVFTTKKPTSAKKFINKLENITEIISQENIENIQKSTSEKNQHNQARDNNIPKPVEQYPMVIKSSDSIKMPTKKNSFILPPEIIDTAADELTMNQSRLSDPERNEMMRLFNKKRRQMKQNDSMENEMSPIVPVVYISNDSSSSKRNSVEIKTKQLTKITNYQQKSMSLIDQLRFNLLELQKEGIDERTAKFYSSSNAFLVNFSKNFLEKINTLITEMPSYNVSQQVLVINCKIYEAVLFYIKNKMFATYDHNLEKLDELVNVISTSILISFEYNIFDENDLISQRFLQECRNLSACIKNIQRKKEIQCHKNAQQTLSKRFNPGNSAAPTETTTRFSMYGLNNNSNSNNTKMNKTKSQLSSKSKPKSSSLALVPGVIKSKDSKKSSGKKDAIPMKRGYSQRADIKKVVSNRISKKDNMTRSRSQPESKIDVNNQDSDESLQVIYPVCDDYVATAIEQVDIDETEHLTPYVPKKFENTDMCTTYRCSSNECTKEHDNIDSDTDNRMGSIKKEFFNAMMDDFNEYRYHGNPDLESNNQTFEKRLQNMNGKDGEPIDKPLITEFMRLELDDRKFN